jgi:hypothetical protein
LGTALIIILLGLILWGFNAVATPLNYVIVCGKTASHKGLLVASTSDMIYVADYPDRDDQTKPGYLDAFSKSDVLATVNGTKRDRVYEFACPLTSSSS